MLIWTKKRSIATINCGKWPTTAVAVRALDERQTSGHIQYVKELTADWDFDTILAKVSQVGVACHTGNPSQAFSMRSSRKSKYRKKPLKVFETVYNIIEAVRTTKKEGSLHELSSFDKGIGQDFKRRSVRECTEIVIALQRTRIGRDQIWDFGFPLSCHGTNGRKGRDLGRDHTGELAQR